MTQLSAADLVVPPRHCQRTSADVVVVFSHQALNGHFSIMEGEMRPGEQSV